MKKDKEKVYVLQEADEEEKEEKQEKTEWEEFLDKFKNYLGKELPIIIFRRETPASPPIKMTSTTVKTPEEVESLMDYYGERDGGIIEARLRDPQTGKFIGIYKTHYPLKEKKEDVQREAKSSQNDVLGILAQTQAQQQNFLFQQMERERQKYEMLMEQEREKNKLELERLKVEAENKERFWANIITALNQQTNTLIQLQQQMQTQLTQMTQKQQEALMKFFEIMKKEEPKKDVLEEIIKLKQAGVIPEKTDTFEATNKLIDLITNTFNLGINFGSQKYPEEKTDLDRVAEIVRSVLETIQKRQEKVPQLQQPVQPRPQMQPPQAQPQPQKLEGEPKVEKKEYKHPVEKLIDDHKGQLLIAFGLNLSPQELAQAIIHSIPDIYWGSFIDYVEKHINAEHICNLVPEFLQHKDKLEATIEELKNIVEAMKSSEMPATEETEKEKKENLD